MSSWCREPAVVRPAIVALAATIAALPVLANESVPAEIRDFLARHCVACHSGEQAQAEVRLDVAAIHWTSGATADWERVHGALATELMPPTGAKQPSSAERESVVAWLEQQLSQHARIGGEVPRRLNREEYEHTVRDLFDFPDFVLPEAFPADDLKDGFDNVGEGLILSPPLMAQYLEVATAIADLILPPARGPAVAVSKRYPLATSDFATSGGGLAESGAFRIVSSRNMASTAAWPDRFEATQSGIYRLDIDAQVFETAKMFYERRTEPLRMGIYARPKADQVYDPFGKVRKVAEFEVLPGSTGSQEFTAEIDLFRGETFGIRWENGPAYSDPPRRDYSPTFLADRLKRDRLYYAAMLQYGGGTRGTTQKQVYEATAALMRSGELDLTDPRLDKLPEDWGGGLSNRPHNWIRAFVHEEMYRFGPALDVTKAEIEGPLRLIDDLETKIRKARTKRFLGDPLPGASKRAQVEAVLRRFLPRAFRRSTGDEEVMAYADLAARRFESDPEARVEDGLHLAVRRALVSPHFLYRGLRAGRLNDFDLASRLSYFLTSAPPDEDLVALARDGRLSEPEVLRRETERLLDDPRNEHFVRSFTGQWLSTRLLRGIMPDPRLLRFFVPDREAMVSETELFFSEILRDNLPVETFIDPGFSYRNENLNKIYGGNLEGREMRRVTFERGGRQGGILSLGSVMMATANGVDTHPVLRGVWLLDNVFGTPTPPPPGNVPAIAPDTSGTTSIRDQLVAHRADPSCARCHNHIDPVGLVLENFDPVGRWREHYPVYTKPPDGAEALKKEFYSTIGEGTSAGPRIDAAAVMADGTELEDMTDLKRYVLERIDMFSDCLTRKLMVYATGRPLGFADRVVANRIVASTKARGNGFRDLLIGIVQSDSFRTR